MACRALLRRRKVVSDYLEASAWSIQNFQKFSSYQSTRYSGGFTSVGNHLSQSSDRVEDHGEVSSFSTSGLLWHRSGGITLHGHGNVGITMPVRLGLISPMGHTLLPSTIRYSSTATAKQPDSGSDDEDNEDLVAKKKKEASPEECDQAVEGLSSAKAKAKAKQFQETQKVAKSVLQRVWATLLGIGPALQAVASMSRLENFVNTI